MKVIIDYVDYVPTTKLGEDAISAAVALSRALDSALDANEALLQRGNKNWLSGVYCNRRARPNSDQLLPPFDL